jgi:hypothetical protein
MAYIYKQTNKQKENAAALITLQDFLRKTTIKKNPILAY